MPPSITPFLPALAALAAYLVGSLSFRRHRQPRDGAERSAHLRLGQSRRDQRASLGKQGGGDPDAWDSTR
jgi:hypothetical protein